MRAIAGHGAVHAAREVCVRDMQQTGMAASEEFVACGVVVRVTPSVHWVLLCDLLYKM